MRTSSLHIVRIVIFETDVIKRDAHIILAQAKFSGYREARKRRRRKGVRTVEEATFIVKEWAT